MNERSTQAIPLTPGQRPAALRLRTALAWRPRSAQGALRTALAGAALLGAFVIFLGLVQFATPNLVGNDGYYHIKLAYLMRTQGLKPDFDWLPLTVLNPGDYVDHHFLFHLALIPFTTGDLRLGAKLASILFPALAFLALWWLLRGQKVPYAGLWSLGALAVSEAFIYRMSMPRAQSLSLLALFLAAHWTLAGKHRRLLPLAFFYVWLYNAFPLILLLAGLYAAAVWLVERRWDWRPLAYAAAGVGLGLIVNPYFPENVLFAAHHILPKISDPTSIRVGSEWYPYETTQLIENSGPALVAFLGGVLALGLKAGRMRLSAALGLLLSILFGAMLFQSRRFVEYFPPFALLFGALAAAPLLHSWTATPEEGQSRRRSWLLPAALTAVLLPALWFNLRAAQHSVAGSKSYQRYAGAAAWLQKNTPAKARVFQTDWDDFPQLFFHNHHNTYTAGLDPTYMQLQDPELFDQWVDITKGRVEEPSGAILERFGASYVMTDLKHGNFIRRADDDPHLTLVYKDDYAAVYQVELMDNH